MKYVLEKITYVEFVNRLKGFQKDLDELKECEGKDIEEYFYKIVDDVEAFLKESVSPQTDRLINMLVMHEREYDFLNFSYLYADTEEEKISNNHKAQLVRLARCIGSIGHIIRVSSVIEALKDPESNVQLNSVTEKNDFILDKLNQLFGDSYYTVSDLFELNNVELRQGEGREIAKALEKRGYVILQDEYGHSDKTKISVKGAAYIERKLKKAKKKKSELDSKIDSVIEHLKFLGYGQEIIFNELEELRGLQHQLSKKSWSQLLKGKMFDLALDKVVSVETASSVFEFLTDDALKLLK